MKVHGEPVTFRGRVGSNPAPGAKNPKTTLDRDFEVVAWDRLTDGFKLSGIAHAM